MTMKIEGKKKTEHSVVAIQSLKPGTTFRLNGSIIGTLFLKTRDGHVRLSDDFFVATDKSSRKDPCAIVVPTTLTED